MTTTTDTDPWTLHGSFYSIIVKRAAVVRSYPGGVEAFERLEEPARKNGALFLLARMEPDGVDQALERLHRAGVVPGEDVAVLELASGPLLECPGVVFASDGDFFLPKWSVIADPDYIPSEAASMHWLPPEAPQPSQQPEATVRAVQPPRGLTANQYYQWRGLHSPDEEEDQ
ncbi:MAG: hypothetical protein PHE36_03845 [Novosphingobium sp.]|nr:hypothetical protein [Novosphingobium sp.]